jgi:hypothetical protein
MQEARMRRIGQISFATLTTLMAVWYLAASLRTFGLSAPELWFGNSFVWLAWMILLGRGTVFQLRLPSAFYRYSQIESNGSMYRRLGISAFRRLTLYGEHALRLDRAKNARPLTKKTSRLYFEERCKFIEAAHALHFLLLSPAVVLALLSHRFALAILTVGILLGFDGYPIALQRYNRRKLTTIARPALRTPSFKSA